MQQLDGFYIAAVQPHGSPHGFLVCTPAAARLPKPLMDAEQQIPMPSALHSLHVLYAGDKRGAGCAAILLSDGTVGTADFKEVRINQCDSRKVDIAESGKQGPGGVTTASRSSHGKLLAVARQATAGSDVSIDVYAAVCTGGSVASGTATLQLVHSCTLVSPSSSSRVSSMSVADDLLALLWRDGSITVYHSNLTQRPTQPDHVATFAVPPAIVATSDQQPANRKRRAADDDGTPGKVLIAAMSDTQLLLMTVQSPSAALYAVLDSTHGCCLASGFLALDQSAGAAGLCNSTVQLTALPPQAPASAVLQVGGSVYLLHLHLPKADLAGLVAKLAVDGSSSAQQTASQGTNRQIVDQQQLNLAAVAAALTSSQGQQQAVQACMLQPVPVAAVQQVAQSDLCDIVSPIAQKLAAVVQQQPVPAVEVSQIVQQLVVALQGQLNASSKQKAPNTASRRPKQQQSASMQCDSQQLPAGAEAVLVSQQLVAQASAALAEAKDWTLLQQLTQLQPLQSLCSCPRLLPALAANHQYALLRQVVMHAQEVPADSLVMALKHLLQQPHSSKAARQAEAVEYRKVAAAAVQAAEERLAKSDSSTASGLLGLACKAAAAVDGFTASEILMHILFTAEIDTVEAHTALQQLSSTVVLKILRYLHKWVQKYAELPLRRTEAVASWAGVGLEGQLWHSVHAWAVLAVPSLQQVIEWTRLVLDAHLTKLALQPSAAGLLQRMQQTLQQEVSGSNRLAALKGITDHMAMGAALPLVAETANSEYTLELLDLRVAGRS